MTFINNACLFCGVTNYNGIAFISTTTAAAITTTNIIITPSLTPTQRGKKKKEQQLCNDYKGFVYTGVGTKDKH